MSPAVRTPTARRLPADTTVVRVAAACRAAFLLFVRTSGKWGKRELAEWLTNHYAKATCLDDEPSPVARRADQSVQLAALHAVLRDARREVIQCAEELLEHGEDARFLSRLSVQGYVVPVRDATGAMGVAPTRSRAMSFADRVLSLLAADFLTFPQQYTSTPRKPISEPPPTGVRMKRPPNVS